MGKGGGKCASREQSAASMRTPRLPATRPTPATKPAITNKALESEGSLEPLISKKEETLRPDPPKEVDDDIDADVYFDQAELDSHATESGRRLLAASPASDYQSEYHTAQPSPALSFSSGRHTPDTLYESGSEDLQPYMASPTHPAGMPLPTKYLRSTVDAPVSPLPDDDDLFPTVETVGPSTSSASVPRPGGLRKRHSMASSSSAQGGLRSLSTSLSLPTPVPHRSVEAKEEPKDLDPKAMEGHEIAVAAVGAEVQTPLEQVKESVESHPSDEVPGVEEKQIEVIHVADQTLAPDENVETSEPPLGDIIVPHIDTAKDIDAVPTELDNEPVDEKRGLEGESRIEDSFAATTQDPKLPETTGRDFAAEPRESFEEGKELTKEEVPKVVDENEVVSLVAEEAPTHSRRWEEALELTSGDVTVPEAEVSKAMKGVPKELENQPVTEDKDDTKSPDVESIVAASLKQTPAETTDHHYVTEPKETFQVWEGSGEDHEAKVANEEGPDFLPAPENTPTSELQLEEPIEKGLTDVKSPEGVSAPHALEVPKDLDSEKEFREGAPIVEPTVAASQDVEHMESTVRDDVLEVTQKEETSKELAPIVMEQKAIDIPFVEDAASLDEHVEEEPSAAEEKPAGIDHKEVGTEPTETTQDEEIPEVVEARLTEVATHSTPVIDDDSHFAEPIRDHTLKPEVADKETVVVPARDEAPLTLRTEPDLVEEAPAGDHTKDPESDLVGERKLQAPPTVEEHDVVEERVIQEAASEATLEPPPEVVKEDDLHASIPHREVEKPESAQADVVQEASDDATPAPVSLEQEIEVVDDKVLKVGPEVVEDKATHPDKFEDALIAGSAEEVAHEPETEVVEEKDIKDPLAMQQVQEKEKTPSHEAASAAECVQEALESPPSNEALHEVEDVTETMPKELEAKPEEKEEEKKPSYFQSIVGMLPGTKPVSAPAPEEAPTLAEHVQSALEPPPTDVSREGENVESTEEENPKENPLNPLSVVIANASQSEPELEEQELTQADVTKEASTGEVPLNPDSDFIEEEIEAPFAEAEVEENKNARSDVVQDTPIEDTTKEVALEPEREMVAKSDAPEQADVVEEAPNDKSTKEIGLEPEEELVEKELEPSLPQHEDVEEPAQTDGVEATPINDYTMEVASKLEGDLVENNVLEASIPEAEEQANAVQKVPTDKYAKEVGMEPEGEVVEKELEPSLPKPKDLEEPTQTVGVEAIPVDDSAMVEVAPKSKGDLVEENELEASLPEAEGVEKQADVVQEAPIDKSTKEVGLEPEDELVDKELEPSLPQPEGVEEPAPAGVEVAPTVDDSIEQVASKPERDFVQENELEASLPKAEEVEKPTDVVEEAPTEMSTKEVGLEVEGEVVEKELESSLPQPENIEKSAQTDGVEAAPVKDSSKEVVLKLEGDLIQNNQLEASLLDAEEVEKQVDEVEEALTDKSTKEVDLEPERELVHTALQPSLPQAEDVQEPAQTDGFEAELANDSTKEVASKPEGDLVENNALEASLPEEQTRVDVVEEPPTNKSTKEVGTEQEGEVVEKELEPSLPQREDEKESAQTAGVEVKPIVDSATEVAPKPEGDLVEDNQLEASSPKAEEVEKRVDLVEELPIDKSTKDVGLEPEEELVEKELEPPLPQPEDIQELAQTDEVEATPLNDSTKEVASKPEEDLVESNGLEASIPEAEEVQKRADVVAKAPTDKSTKEIGKEQEGEVVEKELEPSLPQPEDEKESAQTAGVEAKPIVDSAMEVAPKPEGDLIEDNQLEASLPKAEEVEKRVDLVEELPIDKSTKDVGLEPEEELVEKELEAPLPQPEDVQELAQIAGVEATPVNDSTKEVASKSEEGLVENNALEASIPEAEEVQKRADVVEEVPTDKSTKEVGMESEEEVVETELHTSLPQFDDEEELAQTTGVEGARVDDSTTEVAPKPERDLVENNQLEVSLPEVEQVEKQVDVVEEAPTDKSTKDVGLEPEKELVEKELEPSLPQPEDVEELAQTVGVEAALVDDSTKEVASKPEKDLVEKNELEASLPEAEEVEKPADVVEEAPIDKSTKEVGLEQEGEVVEKELEFSLPQREDVAKHADVVEERPVDESTKEVALEPVGLVVEKKQYEATLGELEVEDREPPPVDESTEDAIVEPESGCIQGKELEASQVDLEAPKKGVTPDVVGEEHVAQTFKESAPGPGTRAVGEIELETSQTEPEVNHILVETPVSESSREVALEPESEVIGENEVEVLPAENKLEEAPLERPNGVEEVLVAETTREGTFEPEKQALDEEEQQALPSEPEVEEKEATSSDDSIEETVVEPQTRPVGGRDEACLPEQEVEEEDAPHTDVLKKATSDDLIKGLATDLEPVCEPVLSTPQETSKELVEELSDDKELEASLAGPKAVESNEPTSVVVLKDNPVEELSKAMVSGPEDVSEPLISTSLETSEERVGALVEEKELEVSPTELEAPATVEVFAEAPIEQAKMNVLSEAERIPKPVLPTFPDEKDPNGSLAQPTGVKPTKSIVQKEPIAQTSEEGQEETVVPHPGPVPQEGHEEQVGESVQEMEREAKEHELTQADVIEEASIGEVPLNPDGQFIKGEKIEAPFIEAEVEEKEAPRSDVFQETHTEETPKEAALEPESEMAAEENARKDALAHEIDESTKEQEGETVKEKDSLPSTVESEKEEHIQADEVEQAPFAGFTKNIALPLEVEVVKGKDLTMPIVALEVVEKEPLQAHEVDKAPVHGGEATIPDVIEEAPIIETTRETGVEPKSETKGERDFEVPLAEPKVEEKDDATDVVNTLDESTKTLPFELEHKQVEEKEWGLPPANPRVVEQEPTQTNGVEASPVDDSTKEVASKPERDLVEKNELEASLPEAEEVEKQVHVVEEAPTDKSTKEVGLEPEGEVVEKELVSSLPQPENVSKHVDVVEERPVDESTKEVALEPVGLVVEKKENEATLGEPEVEDKEPPPVDESTEDAIVEPESGCIQGKELEASQVDLEAPKKGVTPDVVGEEHVAQIIKESAPEPGTRAVGEIELETSQTEPEVNHILVETPVSGSSREVALEPESEVIGENEVEVPPVEAKLEEARERPHGLEEVPVAETTRDAAFEPEKQALDEEELQALPSEPEMEEKEATNPDDMEEALPGSCTKETVVEPQIGQVGRRDEACLSEQEVEEEDATHTDVLKEATSDDPIKVLATYPEPVCEHVLTTPQETSKELVKELSDDKELEASPTGPKAVESKEPTSVVVPEDIPVEWPSKDMVSRPEDVSEPLVHTTQETSEERAGAPVEEMELEASPTEPEALAMVSEEAAIEQTKENLLPCTLKPVIGIFPDKKDLDGSLAQPTATELAELIVQEDTNEETSKEVKEETGVTHPRLVPQEGSKEQGRGSVQEMDLKAPPVVLEAPNTIKLETCEGTQIQPAAVQEKEPEKDYILEEAPIKSTREISFEPKTKPPIAVSIEQDEQEPTELVSSTPIEKEETKGTCGNVEFQAAEPTEVNEGGFIAPQAATEDVKEVNVGVSGDLDARSKSEKKKSEEASVDVHSEGARKVDPMKISNKKLLIGPKAPAEEPQEEIAVNPKQLEAERGVLKKLNHEAAVDVVLQEAEPSKEEKELEAYPDATLTEIKEEVPKDFEVEPTFESGPTSIDEDSSLQKAEPLEAVNPESQKQVQLGRVENPVEATEWELFAPEAEHIAQKLEEASKATGGDKDQAAHLDDQPTRDAIEGDSSHGDWELVASEMEKSPLRVEEAPKNMLHAPTQEQGGEVASPVASVPPSVSEAVEWEMVRSEREVAEQDNAQEPALDAIGSNLTIETKEPESAGLQELVPAVEPIPRSEEVSKDLPKEEETSIETPTVEESTIHATKEVPRKEEPLKELPTNEKITIAASAVEKPTIEVEERESEKPTKEPVETEIAMPAETPIQREGSTKDVPLDEDTIVTPIVQESTNETADRDDQTKTAPMKSVEAVEEPKSEEVEIEVATPATLEIERVSEHLPVQKETIPVTLLLKEPSAETTARGFPVEIEQAPVEVEEPVKKLDNEEVQIGDDVAESVDSRKIPQELPTEEETMHNINPTSKEPISKVISRDLSFKTWHPYMDIAESKSEPKNELAEFITPPAKTKEVTKIESIKENSVPVVEEPIDEATSRDLVVEPEQAPGELEEAHFESVIPDVKATTQTEEEPKDLPLEEETDAQIIESAIEAAETDHEGRSMDIEGVKDKHEGEVDKAAALAIEPTGQTEKEAKDLPIKEDTLPTPHIVKQVVDAAESDELNAIASEEGPAEVEELESEPHNEVGDIRAEVPEVEPTSQNPPHARGLPRVEKTIPDAQVEKLAVETTNRYLASATEGGHKEADDFMMEPKNELPETQVPVPTVETNSEIMDKSEDLPSEKKSIIDQLVVGKTTIGVSEKKLDVQTQEGAMEIEDLAAARDMGTEATQPETRTPAEYKEASEDLPTEEATIPVSDIEEPMTRATRGNFAIEKKKGPVEGEVRAKAAELEVETGKHEVETPIESKEVNKGLQSGETAISESPVAKKPAIKVKQQDLALETSGSQLIKSDEPVKMPAGGEGEVVVPEVKSIYDTEEVPKDLQAVKLSIPFTQIGEEPAIDATQEPIIFETRKDIIEAKEGGKEPQNDRLDKVMESGRAEREEAPKEECLEVGPPKDLDEETSERPLAPPAFDEVVSTEAAGVPESNRVPFTSDQAAKEPESQIVQDPEEVPNLLQEVPTELDSEVVEKVEAPRMEATEVPLCTPTFDEAAPLQAIKGDLGPHLEQVSKEAEEEPTTEATATLEKLELIAIQEKAPGVTSFSPKESLTCDAPQEPREDTSRELFVETTTRREVEEAPKVIAIKTPAEEETDEAAQEPQTSHAEKSGEYLSVWNLKHLQKKHERVKPEFTQVLQQEKKIANKVVGLPWPPARLTYPQDKRGACN